MSYSTNRVVAIPAGKCPVKLQSTKKEDVVEWAEEVISTGFKSNINYLPSSLIFFAQQFFNIFTDDYKTVCNHINLAYNTDSKELQNLIDKISIEKRILDKQKEKQREEKDKEENILRLKKAQAQKPQMVQKTEEKPVEVKKKIVIRRK
jgi:hypothetical protein